MKKRLLKTSLTLICVFALFLTLPLLISCQTGNVEPKYNIQFQSNGGTTYFDISAVSGDTVTLPIPEREGYEFVGWYDNAGFEGEALVDYLTVAQNTTLHAKWQAYEGTIVFVSNGGTPYANLDFKAQKVDLPTPEREGFIFDGWYESKTFEGDALAEEFIPTKDMIVYAKWNAITGSVIFVSNGGTEYAQINTAGQKVALPIPEKEDCIFAGWYDNSEFKGSVYEGEIMPEGTITLYARWSINYILITLEENGGQEVEDVKLFDGDKFTLPTPERWGYSFVGWFDNQDLSGSSIDDYFYYPSSNMTLYAKWEKCSYLYLFYGETKMDWVKFEYKEGDVVTVDELYSLLTPEDIVITDYLGNDHDVSFDYWAHQGEDESSHVKVESNILIKGDFVILVAQYDDSEVPPAEYLTYDKETGVYTVTGKVGHQFIDGYDQIPYTYSLDTSFRKGISGAYGPAFRMRVSDADYHYESGCDYLSPTINPATGSFYIASVLAGKWSNFVTSIDISLLPDSWQEKYANTPSNGLIDVTMSIVDYGTWFEVYIDNDLAYTYTNSTKLANYPYTGLGVRSSSIGVKLSNARVSYGHEVSFVSGVDGLTAQPVTWMCGNINLPNLVRENYALAGWYYDANCTQLVDYENFAPTSDITLYAKWSTDYHIVSFNSNGGSSCASLNYASGKISLPTTTKMNYIFTGWYYDANCTQLVEEDNFKPSSNVTLYAGWRLPYTHIKANADGSYTYNKKTEAVLGTMETALPVQGTYHEFSQTITMTKGAGSVGIAFRMNVNRDYTYETEGTDYISIQFCTNFFRVSRVKNGAWKRLLPNNKDYAYNNMPQVWKDKYTATADGEQLTVVLTVRDYGSYFEAYVDGVLAYTYGTNGETEDLTTYTGNGYGIRCSAGTEVIFDDITAKVVTIN